MAVKTPSAVYTESLGSLTLKVATFTDLDDGDTWASGISGVKYWWHQRTDNPSTQASVGVAIAHSSETFTFYPAEDNAAIKLFVCV